MTVRIRVAFNYGLRIGTSLILADMTLPLYLNNIIRNKRASLAKIWLIKADKLLVSCRVATLSDVTPLKGSMESN